MINERLQMQFVSLQANHVTYSHLEMDRNIILKRWLLVNMENYPLFACDI